MISDFLTPLDPNDFTNHSGQNIGKQISIHTSTFFPEIEDYDVFIVGVKENRNNVDANTDISFKSIRQDFYNLTHGVWDFKIADLGDIEAGNNVEDTYFALESLVTEISKQDKRLLIIGGSHDLSFPVYKGLQSNLPFVNLTLVDNKTDIGFEEETSLSSNNFVGSIITEPPHKLFHLACLGYQTFLINHDFFNVFEKMFFETYRLGELENNKVKIEPLLRDAHFVSIDLAVVKSTDAPGSKKSRVNGFSAKEMCEIARYSGLSNNKVMGVFDFDYQLDIKKNTAQLISQMLWYYLDGYSIYTHETPSEEKKEFIKHHISFNNYTFVFYQSLITDKWWMKVKETISQNNLPDPTLIPCSFLEYEDACAEKIPEKWILAQRKFL